MNKELEIQIVAPPLNKDGININLSSAICKYLGITKKNYKEMFIIPTNGVIQISHAKPYTTIPALTDLNAKFEKQNFHAVLDEGDDNE